MEAARPVEKAVEAQAQTFGRYRLLEVIGSGGMAEVFLAKMEGIEGFERRLAIKRILPHYSKNQNFVRMFIDEARLVGHFTHPNIVQIFDFGKIDDCYYISMEYVDGIPIADILTRYKAAGMFVPLEVILEIAIQACRGIDYAHKETDEEGNPLSIIHRDLTPHNILISKKGIVKITDFGIAKASMNTHLTQAGMIKGKVPYMSPEQAMGRQLTQVSDVFALGIVIWEMCALRRLFDGGNDLTILKKVQEARIPSIREINPNVPHELERILSKALARDRDERYQTAGEVEMDLTRLKFSHGDLSQKFDLGAFIRSFAAGETSPGAVSGAKAIPGANGGRDGQSLAAIDDGSEVDDSIKLKKGKSFAFGGQASDSPTKMLQLDENGEPVLVPPEPEELELELEPEAVGGGEFEPQAADEEAPLAVDSPVDKFAAPPELSLNSSVPAPELTRRRKRSRLPQIGLVALLFLGLAAAGVWFFAGEQSTLELVGIQPGSKVFVNGVEVQSIPASGRLEVAQGPVEVEVQKEGFETFHGIATASPDGPATLAIELKPLQKFGFLVLRSEPPGAKVLLKNYGGSWKTPCKLNLAPDSPYELKFELDGFSPKKGVFSVALGQEQRVFIDFNNPGPPAIENEPSAAAADNPSEKDDSFSENESSAAATSDSPEQAASAASGVSQAKAISNN